MSKVLLFSDIHIHPHKKDNNRLKNCLDILPWVFKVAKENNIKNILFGGDFFHDRQKIDIFTYHKTFEVLNNEMSEQDFNLYLLLGNHDLWFYDDTSISSVFPLSLIKGVKVIDKPCRIKIEDSFWDFLPFTVNPVDSLKQIFKDNENTQPEYLLGHIAINNARMHKGHYSSDIIVEHDGELVSVDSNIFSKYRHVFLGHFHSEQKVSKNIEYIGSPLQLSFGESFEKKHIIIFEPKTNKKQYIENDFSPKHIVCDDKNIDEHSLTGNFVQVLVEDVSKIDLINLKKNISSNSEVLDLKIKQKTSQFKSKKSQDEKDKEIVFSSFNEKDMIEKYISEKSTNLDKIHLKKIAEKICSNV